MNVKKININQTEPTYDIASADVTGSSSTEVEFVSKPGYYWDGWSYT